ncbi:37S ribosomal protein SWS2, mitochondrial [Smittium culicis]|uniref:37S ribosomal protein SWS2, mitochondrial n=1 Tax=Smittium culicis TaxID=133412 RepID=A0A1R1XFX0_9FUNG|nr:37S ribosomal protein SWS2, mitochondrial [Smittium culicis]
MLHLLGVNLPDQKVVSIALTHFYGIGRKSALQICSQLSIHRQCKLHELTEPQINSLTSILSSNLLESDLSRVVSNNILRLKRIKSYVGMRHSMNLPVHGQRTRNNCKTAKRLNGRFVRKYTT